ncbi:MAG: cell wall metabolism sensor histidine kinase WalK [Phycisphaerales bacterium]|nr:cell wall metabolism sensor histidine kinase WalK [Phycisphaerales bacterium]MCI0676551.1 cell wall metabolism sensor histidine kinase WalK [Phycisphaerales bacterium]
MQAGKIASLILVLLVTAVATLLRVFALWAWELDAAPATTRVWMFAAIVGAVSATVLIPMGGILDRSITKLRKQIENAATSSQPIILDGLSWLQPISRAFIGAVDQFQQRERALRNQLGDLEIRHRVSEAERRQVEAVLHALRDAVVVTDAFNEVVMANQTAAAVLGFDLKAALHKPIDDVIHDQALRQLIRDTRDTANFTDTRHVEQAVSGGKPADGGTSESRVFDITLSCVENHKHEVGGVVTILHDLTREREISQMKSDFVSKASHELRTPLSSIRAYVEMLVDGEATDEASRAECYRIMQNETERLGRLIDNMLNISRIEAGIVQIDRENVDMKGLVKRALHTLEPQAKEKKMALHTRLAAIDLCVEGDADMLYQVVLNLVSNGVKYTPEGGRVTIAADSDNLTRSVLVTVSDTGLGIPPDALPKLFDKFYRVENYKRVAKGTGLGLSLCKHIVETVHHGQIGVESKLGMGSKFWFSIPMRYAGSKAAA